MKRIPIVIDTREQLPLDFSNREDVRVIRREIWPGDYSLQTATNYMAIERKSVSDLVGTMKTGYAGFYSTTPKRFDRELKALRGYSLAGFDAFVVVEPDAGVKSCSLEQIKSGNYRASIAPEKVMAFVRTIRKVWQVPVVFANNREHAADIVYMTARKVDEIRRNRRDFDSAIRDVIGEEGS